MAWTRTNYVDEAKAHADAKNSSRWDATTILRIGDMVYQREWRNLLNANPLYRYAKRNPSVDSTGRIALSDLSTATQRLYKVLTLGTDNDIWPQESFLDNPLEVTANLSSGSNFWILTGDYIQLLPATTHSGINVWTNHMPQKFSDYAASDNVTFPDGYEHVVALEMAAIMLAKGGAETNEASYLKALADEARGDLLADVARTTAKPLLMRVADDRGMWGG